MDYLLSTNKLSKKFSNGNIAVNNVNLHINKGDIYGFIGRNGAGKTTFLRMISGMAEPSSGELSIFGYTNKDLKNKKVFSRIGALIEAPGLYPNLTAFENIKMKCICYGYKNKNAKARTVVLLPTPPFCSDIDITFAIGTKKYRPCNQSLQTRINTKKFNSE